MVTMPPGTLDSITIVPADAEAESSAGAPPALPLGADPAKDETGPAEAPFAPSASDATVLSCWLPASDASGFATPISVGPGASPVFFVTGAGTAFPAPFEGITIA